MACDGNAPVEVDADPSRLKQVVVNLLDNAIKYTAEGGKVSISVTQHDGHAIFEVADSGLGTSADDLPHVFERFDRADKARSRQMGGTGLGLSIVRSICAAHGGQVTVSSTEGCGSLFHRDPFTTRYIGPIGGRSPSQTFGGSMANASFP
jgi:signal transduction histidine kinase